MTVAEAIEELRSAGGIEVKGTSIRCRVPRRRGVRQAEAVTVLRQQKGAALELLTAQQGAQPPATPPEPLEAVLKGQAIALYADLVKETIWLVADEEDMALLQERRGSVYSASEIHEVTKIDDPETVAEIHRWKRAYDAKITHIENLRDEPPRNG